MSPILKFVVVCTAIGSVIAYENAYDLLERRNRRFYKPGYFRSAMFYEDKNPFFGESQNLFSGNVNPRFSSFGNGYDNLGNGIPAGHSRPFRQQLSQDWRYDRRPFRERTFDDFGFQDRGHLTNPDYINYHPEVYHPPHRRSHQTPDGYYGQKYRKGNVDRFVEENEDKQQKKNDEVYQRSQEGVNMDTVKKEKAGEESRSDQMGENKSSIRSNSVVKKGRTTKGFAVHHHKDETGNSTTFFDETSDFGGHSDLRDIADGFGTRKTLEQIVHRGDEKHFKENGGQSGNYGTGLFVGNQKFAKDFSSKGNHEDSGGKFHSGNENDGFVPRKTYQYLNGDPFEYTQPQVDSYY